MKSITSNILCLLLFTGSLPAQTTVKYPYKTLLDAFRSIEFNPKAKNCNFFVVTADVHYGVQGSDGVSVIVQEVNEMQPQPAFFCVNGDIILNGSLSFGKIPDTKGRQAAIREFNEFKADATQLNPNIPLILTLGNHDTHPKEVDPEIFWEVFPGYPPYQSKELAGVHLVFLNGHSTGYIDDIQMQWLISDIQNISDKQTVIVFVHQPSMSRPGRERGIPEAITKIFENHKGRIWLIGGHEHVNDQQVFQLKNTKLIEHKIVCGALNIWGGGDKPGYWVYCLCDGQVVGRIYRQRDQGYRIESYPDTTICEIPPTVPFSRLKGVVSKIMIGEGDREFLITAHAGDCLNYWSYVKELVYRFPMDRENNINHIAMLTDYQTQDLQKKGQYYLSPDLMNWIEIGIEKADREILLFSIPESLKKAKNIYFKYTPSGEVHVSGFALLK